MSRNYHTSDLENGEEVVYRVKMDPRPHQVQQFDAKPSFQGPYVRRQPAIQARNKVRKREKEYQAHYRQIAADPNNPYRQYANLTDWVPETDQEIDDRIFVERGTIEFKKVD